jgi:succinyl-diaminopimelate desuccinylase
MNRRSNDVTAQSAAILSWLRHQEDEMAALLADLVAIPTENPPGKNYRACVDFLENHLRQAGLDCERWGPGVSRNDAANSPESLLATYGSGEPALYFHGH